MGSPRKRTGALVAATAMTTALATGLVLLPTALAAAAPAAAPVAAAGSTRLADLTEPTLVARATLSADFLAEGPPSGALVTPANGRTGPFDGQVIPGFSGFVEGDDGQFWALPDNGFGTKANSADFLLRIYEVTPDWETADGGAGAIGIDGYLSLRDPDGHVDFPIVNEGTPERLLTGGDFDVESIVRLRDGSFWIGEEFGPFLLHVDATGKLLSAPVPFVGGKSPQNPYLGADETPNVRASRGFEAMAVSKDGRYLYPMTEGAFVDDAEQRRRTIYQFDLATEQYTGATWQYEADRDANVLGDAFAVGNQRLLVVERDDFEGSASVTKRVYAVDLTQTEPDGYLKKTLVLDALKIANPDGIGDGDGYGTGERFSLPVQSFETIVQLRDGRLLIANDNNYPGNDARITGTPDDTEMAVVDLRRVPAAAPSETTVIGHRGASGERPEHTLAAYEQAILACADYIEPDLVSTKDGVLVDRHENEISGTTDVATRPEFADRRTTKVVDGVSLTGWFTEDFTLAELRTLRAVERLPLVRPDNTAYDGLYEIPTFDEVIDLARRSVSCDGRPVGVIPELKHGTYFDGIGLSMEEPLVAAIADAGWNSRGFPVQIQSFEVGNLVELNGMTTVRLVQLIDAAGAPADKVAAGDPLTYADMVTRAGLHDVAEYADVVSLQKNVMIPRTADDTLGTPTPVIGLAHALGLEVTGWTFRKENQFLPAEFRSSADPNATGDLAGEIEVFVAAGMDNVFTDDPAVAVRNELRVATYNLSLNRAAASDLATDLGTPDNAQAQAVAEVIQTVDPDVVLLNEFDYDAEGASADLFRANYLEVPQGSQSPVTYPYAFYAPVNTGVPSGFDLNNDGTVGGGDDAWGFGTFPGQYGMLVLSKYPIDRDAVRTFQTFRWQDMPGNVIPEGWYDDEELAAFPLSSKSHWDVPVLVDGRTVHVLAAHPTPPSFDGPEDRNGRRNHDEIRFWADYVRGGADAAYIYDDAGVTGGLTHGDRFVVVGDYNADPADGDSYDGAIHQLLGVDLLQDPLPTSAGGPEAASLQGGANAAHTGDPALDTADFADTTPGNLRVDYVLPSRTLGVTDAGIFWPAAGEPGSELTGTFPFPTSDHRLVWADLQVDLLR